jgi:hypothetical protein
LISSRAIRHGKRKLGKEGDVTKRIAAGAVTTVLLMLGAAGTAAADPGNGQGQGPGFCLGPPGQTGLVATAKLIGVPPGQLVSHCNGNGHGQNQDSTGVV